RPDRARRAPGDGAARPRAAPPRRPPHPPLGPLAHPPDRRRLAPRRLRAGRSALAPAEPGGEGEVGYRLSAIGYRLRMGSADGRNGMALPLFGVEGLRLTWPGR